MEHDAVRKLQRPVEKFRRQQADNATYYLLFICAFTCSLLVVLYTTAVAVASSKNSVGVAAIGGVVAFAIAILSEIARTRSAIRSGIVSAVQGWVIILHQSYERDFLARHYWTSWLLWVPLLIGSLIMGAHSGLWVSPGDAVFGQTKEIITPLVALLAGLLGAQLTLFTFLVGTILGRYSGNLAQAVIWHRAIRSVVGFVMVALASLVAELKWGYPSGCSNWTSLILVLTLAATLISVWIALSGMSSEGALRYVGIRFSTLVRRTIHRPLTAEEMKHPNVLWKCLTAVGLDFRDANRFVLLVLPTRAVNKTRSFLTALFNAAQQSIRDGQQENLHGCLESIAEVMRSYTLARTGYPIAGDPVFGYANDQAAALMRVAVQNADESLLTSIIAMVGTVSKLSLNVGRYPNMGELTGPQATMLPVYWMGLLQEGFEMGFGLKRSSGATEALIRLQDLAILACHDGYAELVEQNFLSIMVGFHRRCLTDFDAYHAFLAGDCIRRVMGVWVFSATHDDRWHTGYRIHDAMLKSVLEMAVSQFGVQRLPALDFSDAGDVLIAKVAADSYIIQDVLVFTMHRKLNERWEIIKTGKQVTALVALLADLGVKAVEQRAAYAGMFCLGLYECGYIVLKHWPPSIDISGQPPLPGFLGQTEQNSKRGELYIRAAKDLLEALATLMSVFFRADVNVRDVYDSEASLFGLLGIAIFHFHEEPDVRLGDQLTKIVRNVLGTAQEQALSGDRNIEWCLRYLRLAGAWADSFLLDADLVQEIVHFLSGHQSPNYASIGSAGYYSQLGYPSTMHGDFALPYLANLRQGIITQDDEVYLRRVQEALICDAVLVEFYRKISA
jgi:hypothetical protein